MHIERVRVAFRPAVAEGGHSGVTIGVEGQALEFMQVSREDWIEASNRSWRVTLAEAQKAIEVTVRLIDDSRDSAVRADLRRLTITPEE